MRKSTAKIIKMNCDFCGKEIEKKDYEVTKTNFCSRVCQNTFLSRKRAEKIKAENEEVTCYTCGKSFYRKKSHRAIKNFCSEECKNKYYEEQNVKTTCAYCKKEIKIPKSRFNKCSTKNLFCSVECHDNFQRRTQIKTLCINCLKDITIKKSQYENSKTKMFFCGNKCANAVLLSKLFNPNFKGIADITAKLRHYYETEQRSNIFFRDGYKCQVCGAHADEVHHIYPLYRIIEDYIKEHPEFDLGALEGREALVKSIIEDKNNIFNDFNNLISVCKKCHDSVYHGKNWKKKLDKKIDNQQPSPQ